MALTTVPVSLSATALTLTTAAQPNITSVGTLTGLTTSGNINVTGNVDASNSILVGTNNSYFAENVIRFKSSGAAYFDHETVGQSFVFRVSNSSSFDTSALQIASDGDATFAGTIATGGITINGAGSTISDSSDLGIVSGGTLTMDVAGSIILDADSGEIDLQDGGTGFGQFAKSGNDFRINQSIQDGDIVFRGNDGGSVITAMTIDMSEAGKVGMGITNPAAALNISSTTGNLLTIQNSTYQGSGQNTEAILRFKAGSGTDDERAKGGILFKNDGSAFGRGDLHFLVDSNDDNGNAIFADSKMVISHEGNVGIGATPHSWGTFQSVAQIGRTGAIANYDGSNSNQQTIVASNTYYGASGYTAIEGAAKAVYMNLQSGNINFLTAPITSAGSAQTFTNVLNITNAGAATFSGIITASRFINGSNSSDPWLKGINSSGTETSFIKKDGSAFFNSKVGIGTTTLNKLFNLADPAQGGEALKLHFEASSANDKWAIYSYDRTNSHYADLSFGANYLYLKSGGNVGIGLSNPTRKLHIVSTGSATYAGNSAGSNIALHLANLESGAAGRTIGISMSSESNAEVYLNCVTAANNNGGDFVIASRSGGRSEKMRLHAAGPVTKPLNPSFNARYPAVTNGGGTTIVFSSTHFNIGSHYNTSNGIFTAPVAGSYLFTFQILMDPSGTNDYARVLFARNGTSPDTTLGDTLETADYTQLQDYQTQGMTAVIFLNANDTLRLINNGNSPTYGTSYGSFSGYLLG